MVSAQCTMREGVHSRCARWLLGRCSSIGDGLPAPAAAQVRGHARAFVQDLDRGGRRADLDQFVHQVVGHAVEVGIEAHVVIDVDAGARPLAQIERLDRQRLQSRFIDGFANADARLPSRLRKGR